MVASVPAPQATKTRPHFVQARRCCATKPGQREDGEPGRDEETRDAGQVFAEQDVLQDRPDFRHEPRRNAAHCRDPGGIERDGVERQQQGGEGEVQAFGAHGRRYDRKSPSRVMRGAGGPSRA